MIIDILTDSIRYSVSKPKNILVLGILTLFDFLIIPLIFALGYYYKVTKESTRGMINGDDKMPSLDNFKELFIDGIKVLTVAIIYCIPVFILYIVLLNCSRSGKIPYILVDFITDGVFFIFYCYFYMALPNMAFHDSFRKAFDFKQINNIIIKKIGIIPLIVVLSFIDFLEFVFESISIDISDILNTLLNNNSFSAQSFTFFITTSLIAIFISPFIDTMISRSTGLLYVHDE